MAPRRKQACNTDMPIGLSPVRHRKIIRYRYRYPSGKDFWFPIDTPRHVAVEAAMIFNAEHRNPVINLIKNSDKYNKPLKYWLPKVIQRVKADENLSPQVLKTFLSNCKKLLLSHGDVLSKSICMETVNEFVDAHAGEASNEVQNRKVIFLNKVFDYLVDMSAIEKNYARDKKLRPTQSKRRKRLSINNFKFILEKAPHFLRIAMMLSLQTTHAVLEVSKLKYKDCKFLDTPLEIDGVLIYGYLRIHRQKVKDKESSRVEIPITDALNVVINESRKDKILGPYIVHRIAKSKTISKACNHPTQVTSEYISKAFSRLRDELGLYDNIEKAERPTFHEIRALAIHLYTQAGFDPQARAAHADAKSTKVYQENHVDWVRVPAAEIAI